MCYILLKRRFKRILYMLFLCVKKAYFNVLYGSNGWNNGLKYGRANMPSLSCKCRFRFGQKCRHYCFNKVDARRVEGRKVC